MKVSEAFQLTVVYVLAYHCVDYHFLIIHLSSQMHYSNATYILIYVIIPEYVLGFILHLHVCLCVCVYVCVPACVPK